MKGNTGRMQVKSQKLPCPEVNNNAMKETIIEKASSVTMMNQGYPNPCIVEDGLE